MNVGVAGTSQLGSTEREDVFDESINESQFTSCGPSEDRRRGVSNADIARLRLRLM